MSMADKLQDEFGLIGTTAFWKKYIEKIESYRARQLEQLKDCRLDRVPELQGMIKAADAILRFPNDVVRKSEEADIKEK